MKNFTTSLLFICFLLLFSFMGVSQEGPYRPGTENYLLVKRGFKIFKLGSSINDYTKHVKFIRDEYESQEKTYQVIDTSFLSIGEEIRLNKIIISTYRDTIMSISIFVNRPYVDKFLSILRAAYGQGIQPNRFIKEYKWTTYNNEIVLSYDTEITREKNGFAMFLDRKVASKQKEDKRNKAQENINNI